METELSSSEWPRTNNITEMLDKTYTNVTQNFDYSKTLCALCIKTTIFYS